MSPRARASTVEALVFDIGNVILRVHPDRAARALASRAAVGAQWLLRIVAQEAPLKDFQEGRVSAREWYRRLRGLLGLRVTYREFCDAWNLALDPKPILEESLFAILGKQYRLILLSNTDPIHVRYMQRNYGFPEYFAARLYSCALGASKPEPVVYREAIQRAGVQAGQILYTDDVAENVEAGRKAGMQAFRFRNRRQFLTVLRRRGVLR
jgi:FMN phosphatase YigB (HAD superfamily)